MAEKLTSEQRMAVENRGGKLLVSAAAGSGKTKVLVDRLIGHILDPINPANIDDFLIITYTKAAASELRGKIASKLSLLIAEGSPSRHLQQQMQRLYLAKISTVHAFCTDILRQYAYRLDLSADFRVVDESECLEFQMKALEQVLDSAYETAQDNPDFCAFIDSQGLGRDDRQIPEIILKVYNSARCHLNPEQWLDWCVTLDGFEDISDVGQTLWGQFLIEDLRQYLNLQISSLQKCINTASGVEGLEKPVALLLDTVWQLGQLSECRTWNEIVRNKDIDYGRLTIPKKCNDVQLAEQIKAVRNACKEGLSKRLRSFTDESDQVIKDIKYTASSARGLIWLVKAFTNHYEKLKKNRNVLDFGDLEHKTLDLLLGKNRNHVTAAAYEIGGRFREIMVDEYQDTNGIQDAIFSALTNKRKNCFMVGDVKQSIYQFRLADPRIFIDKYNSYLPADIAQPGDGRKVILSNNFRSSLGIIQGINDVFTQCMSPAVGGLTYGYDEALREGIPHVSLNEPEVSLCAIDVQQDTYAEEAAYVADNICMLLDGSHMVRDGDVLRPIIPEDIVILLRSPGSVGAEFQYALSQRGIRCITGDTANLLQTEEIATTKAILQVINNPLLDIPLVSALVSPVFGYTAEDLAILRDNDRHADMYSLLLTSQEEKSRSVIQTLTSLRNDARLMSATQLLATVYSRTNLLSIYSAMEDGQTRLDNLQAFFQIVSDYETAGPKDLGHLLEYLDLAEERGLSSAGSLNTDGAVTIMSIHKSKGLEFPVVFLCGLSRSFNQESARGQVLCDKDLGLGLSCVDSHMRVKYPTVIKRAISVKTIQESISEEMRVLYVAMTRARDRLIMTYAAKNLASDLQDIALRLDMSSGQLLTMDVDCPGAWVLQSALSRSEAGEFFAISCHPDCATVKDNPWEILLVQGNIIYSPVAVCDDSHKQITQHALQKLSTGIQFSYPHRNSTQIPSKLTATQLKGRDLDSEIAEDTRGMVTSDFRKPSISRKNDGKAYGNAIHSVLQYIDFRACRDVGSIRADVERMVSEKRITPEQGEMVNCEMLAVFFKTPLGLKLQNSTNVLREFKFSILDDARKYYADVDEEKILLQGVVDCALIEDDGIIVLDFKTDYVTEDTLPTAVQKYKSQVNVYANAMKRIYKKPIKSALLYFFELSRFIEVI